MRLESLDGRFVDLAVTAYQFGGGPSTSAGDDWDANWLMIRGNVWDGAESWEFRDPCMTTWEARELASWLRALGRTNRETDEAADPESVRLGLTEPNLVFALAAATQDVSTIDVYFDGESRPPGCSCDDHEGLGHRVSLTIPQTVLAVAVAEWERDLAAFPTR